MSEIPGKWEPSLTPYEIAYLENMQRSFGGGDPNLIIGGPRERITMAAVRCPHGRIFLLPQPARHHNVIWHMLDEYGYHSHEVGPDYQGFVTSTGRYVDRKEAWRIAEAAGQLLPIAPTDGRGGRLYSEDVW